MFFNLLHAKALFHFLPTFQNVCVTYSGLTSIHRKSLYYISIHRKCLSYNSIHQMYGKMLIVQFSYIFKNSLKKDSNYFLRLFEPTKTVYRWNKTKFLFWKKRVIIQFPYMKCVLLAIFWWRQVKLNLTTIFFVFFSTAYRILHSNKHFSKKICVQNFIFCLHNVVLDTQELDFFPFLWITFFKQAKNSYFFCMACL